MAALLLVAGLKNGQNNACQGIILSRTVGVYLKANKISIKQRKSGGSAFPSVEVDMQACPATSLRVDGLSKDEGSHATLEGQPKNHHEIVAGSAPSLLDCENASMMMHATYVDSIRHMAPALADILHQALAEPTQKPLAERSTEELIVQIDASRFLAEIARLWGVPASNLSRWIEEDSDRLRQANLARKNQAALWDWVGLQVLLHAPSDRVEIGRAEKIARHCRWRAERFNRDDYGQQIKVTQVDERNAREFTTRELEIIAGGGEIPS